MLLRKLTLCLSVLVVILSLTPLVQAKRSKNKSQMGASAATANPTRPSVSDNAYLVTPGYLELEIGGLIDPTAFAIPTLLKAAINKHIEVGLSSTGLVSVDRGASQTKAFQDPGLQVKSLLVGTEHFSFATVGRAEWIDHGDAQFTLYGVASAAVSKIAADVTLGGALAPQGSGDYETDLNYAVALYPNWDNRFDFYGELFGTHGASGNPVGVDAGVSFAITPRLVIDTAIFKGLNAAATDWQIQAGLTWTIARILP